MGISFVNSCLFLIMLTSLEKVKIWETSLRRRGRGVRVWPLWPQQCSVAVTAWHWPMLLLHGLLRTASKQWHLRASRPATLNDRQKHGVLDCSQPLLLQLLLLLLLFSCQKVCALTGVGREGERKHHRIGCGHTAIVSPPFCHLIGILEVLFKPQGWDLNHDWRVGSGFLCITLNCCVTGPALIMVLSDYFCSWSSCIKLFFSFLSESDFFSQINSMWTDLFGENPLVNSSAYHFSCVWYPYFFKAFFGKPEMRWEKI